MVRFIMSDAIPVRALAPKQRIPRGSVECSVLGAIVQVQQIVQGRVHIYPAAPTSRNVEAETIQCQAFTVLDWPIISTEDGSKVFTQAIMQLPGVLEDTKWACSPNQMMCIFDK